MRFDASTILLLAETTNETQSHTLEWYLVWSTVGLMLVTLLCALVTGLLTWVTWKTFKKEADNSALQIHSSTAVANNSIDSIEHVAIQAITTSHSDRIRRMKKLRKGSGI